MHGRQCARIHLGDRSVNRAVKALPIGMHFTHFAAAGLVANSPGCVLYAVIQRLSTFGSCQLGCNIIDIY
jgi:ABC-type maltose transport system permease subunit